jgi:excisionase family DNA binding protein
MSQEPRDLTVEQVAKEMQVHKRRVYRWIQAGMLTAIDIGIGGKHNYRISRVDLDAFKQARKTRRESED